MRISNRSGRAERLAVVCDHYLDLGRGLREEGSGSVVIWPCPSCARPSFFARFEEGVVGCAEEGCEVPASMGLLELIAYLDGDLEVGDNRAAANKFGNILEEAVRAEQERQHKDEEQKQRAREERRWQRGIGQGTHREGWPQERLFDRGAPPPGKP